MNPGPALLRVLAPEEALVGVLRKMASQRGNVGPRVEIMTLDGPAGEVLRSLRTGGIQGPLGYVGRSEAEAFAAIEAGADDACVAEGLDVRRFIAFLDRVALRASHRREDEIRRADVAHREKLAALGTVVAGVAHEINNPLTVILMVGDALRAALGPLLAAQRETLRLVDRHTPASHDELVRLSELARTNASPAELDAMFDDVATSTKTITEIVRDLRIFARAEDGEKHEPVYLPDLVDHVLRIVGGSISSIATLELDYGPNIPVLLLPRGRLAQVFTNLLVNAAHAIAATPRPMHRVRLTIRCDGGALAASVADSGPGIAPEIVERIFDPFFTTKTGAGAVTGTGLGLSISRSILQSLGGDLVVESVHGDGATFIAIIPTAGRTAQSLPATTRRDPPASSGVMGHRPTVLVIDDEAAVLRSIAVALRGRFDLILAGDGQEAIDLLASGSHPDAVVCDITMPIVDGGAFFHWLRLHHPEFVSGVVFMTGDPASPAAARLAQYVGRPALEKPISRERLIGALTDLLEGPDRRAKDRPS
jgi:two-component system NtrC family sensor kinase